MLQKSRQGLNTKYPLISLNIFLFKLDFFHARSLGLFKNYSEEMFDNPSLRDPTGNICIHLFQSRETPKHQDWDGKCHSTLQTVRNQGVKLIQMGKMKPQRKMYWGRKKNILRQIRESNNYFTDLLMGLSLLRTCLGRIPRENDKHAAEGTWKGPASVITVPESCQNCD